MTIPFIKYTRLWIIISVATALLCLFFLAKWGLKPGIDFTGGSLLEISFSEKRPAIDDVKKIFEEQQQKDTVLQKSGDKDLLIRTNFLSEDAHQKILSELGKKFNTDKNKLQEKRFETIGGVISQQLRQRAIWAIIFVNIGIVAYVAYAFRKVSRPVPSWKYGILAIVALLHDVLLVLGVFAILGHWRGVEIDTGFVVAILTVLGYSVNDTIVVYDRIRENLLRRSADNFDDVVNNGLNQSLMRSINTTAKTLLPLIALFFFGGSTIHYFTLALLIGIASGAYSSIFIASPLLVLARRWQNG